MEKSWPLLRTRLQRSKFRAAFCLKPKDREYLWKKGWAEIEEHAKLFIKDRLAAARPKNDGKQTPFSGHPVFTAQHAIGACCRGCLEKWHSIPKGRELSDEEIDRLVGFLLEWMKEDIKNPHLAKGGESGKREILL